MGRDRIRMTRDKYILYLDTRLDEFMSDLKRPGCQKKRTKMLCSFMQKLSVLTRQEEVSDISSQSGAQKLIKRPIRGR